MNYWIGYLIILFFVGSGLMALLLYSYRRFPTYPFLTNIILMLISLFIIFMALEFYLKVFFAEPHAMDTLARQNWRERYANPKSYNSFGYRDIQWTEQMVADKTKIMIVGDSFVYGDGIEDVRDRFSDRLGQKLGSDHVIFNLGRGGTNTKHHIEAMVQYPYSPDILILSYFLNDIQGAALEHQWTLRPKNPEVIPWAAPLVNNSYALNFLYWRLYALLQVRQPDLTWDWYLQLYNDPDSWWVYRQQLLSICEGAKAEGIPLVVIVFPSMNHVAESQVINERIISLFQEKGVPVLDVADFITGIPTEALVASPMDAHPSELVHQLVADHLYELLVTEDLVKPVKADLN